MKLNLLSILFILIVAYTSQAQVKVGENPDQIHNSSLLELESADKVFVLSRVNDNQMNQISPLAGGMVYNTDQNCVFQYNGTNWVSLCSNTNPNETITFILDNNDGTFSYTNENGDTTIIDKAQLVDNNNGTFTFINGATSTNITFNGTDDQQLTLATGNVLTLEDGGTVNLTPFLDNTDDQAITASLDNTTNILTITLEDGGTQTVDFSTVLAAAGTDDQQLTLAAGNVLTLEDGGTVNLTPFLDNTDDQVITASLDNTTNILTITLEDGGTQTVDFSTVLAAAGTDDQQLTLAAGNVLTLEDGGTVNLTPFLDNTDDQAITASLDNTTNILTITLEDGGTQTVDFSTVLAAAGTDDQTVDQFQFDNTTNELSISVEDDGVAPLTVDLSALDNAGTDDQQLTLAAGNVLTLEDGGTVNLTPFLDNTDDQAITASLDNTTNVLTITLEDGGTQTVDFSTVLAAAGTDDQQLTLAAGNVLTLEDGGTVNLTPFLDNTDDQVITASLDNTTNVLTITLEDGGTQTVDFSTVLAAAGTDDQTVDQFQFDNTTNELSISVEDDGVAPLTVDLSALDNAGTDDQQLTLAAGNVLTLEDGGTVNLTPFLDNTDDQAITASLDNTTNVLTITLEDGGTQTVDFSTVLAASGTDDQQLTLAAGNVLTLEDGGTVNLTPFLDNTDDQAITASLDNTTNVLTITLEDGGTQTVDFSTVLAAAGTDDQTVDQFQFDNTTNELSISVEDDGVAPLTVDLSVLDNAGTDDQQLTLAAGNVLTLEDGGTVNLTPFLDNTDDQAITASLDNTTNVLTITLEDGGTQTVDFSTVLAAAGTDDQQLTLTAGNVLTLEDGGTVNLTPFLDNTDDQVITASLDNTTNILTITLEDGGTQTVDFSTVLAAAGTDDQTVDQFQFDNTTNELSISVEDDGVAPLTVDLSALDNAGTDDQQLTLAAGNVLTLEDGGTVNLTPFLDNTDDQAITASLDNTTNVLTITLEDGGTQTVDFSTVLAAAGTDDQQLTLAAGNVLTLEDGGTVNLTPFLDNTDDQAITASLDNTTNILTITLEDGGTQTVDFSTVLAAAGTDDQQLTLAAGNVLTLEDGGTVNLTPFLDNTDDQAITASLDNTTNILTITLEDGGTQTVDFSTVLAAAGTDDQQLTLAAGNVLTLEDGGTVNLTPFLDNTDDQAITASLDNTTNVLTITLEDGGTQTVDFSTVLAAAGTDDQQLTLAAGNVLTLEDGGTVNLTPFLDNTDDQAITASLDNTTNVLTITLEDGGTQTVDFSTVLAAAGTDDQQLTLAAGNVLTLEDGGTVNLTPFLDNTDDQAITASLDNTTNVLTITLEDGGTQTVDFSTVLAAAGTDDQQLTLAAGNVLTLEDGGTVNLTPFLDNTDDQAITASLDNTTNVLTITLEDGGTQTVDFSTVLAAAGTDDQQLTLAAGNVLTLEDGGTVNLTPFLDNTDDQAITASLDNTTNVLTITLEDGGTQTVDFSTVLAAAGTDDQTVDQFQFDNTTNELSISVEDDGVAPLTVDLSALDNAGTDDQQLTLAAGNVLTLEDGGTVNLTPFLDNTDDQVITASLDNTTNILTITLEDGGTQTVDFSTVLAAAGTDDQQLTLAAGNVLTLEDGGTVNLTPFLDNTDDQAITASLDNTTNILTITLEDGGTQTVDFSTVLAAAGTDDQTVDQFQFDNTTNELSISVEDDGVAPLTVDLSALDNAGTDDQQLTLAAGNVLTLEDGGTVNLTPFLDNTDDQAITASLDNTTNVLTITLEDGGTQTVDFSTVLAAAGTDDQQLTLAAGNVLTLEDGGTVNLTPFLDNTDDQVITASLDNTTNVLTITLEDGGTQTVDFSTVLAAAGTDDQTVDQFQFDNTTNELSISVEDDGVAPLTVDLSALDNAGTDDQQLTLAAGNVLTLEDGGTVNLTPFLDNTDDQAITASLDNTTNVLTITLEDGGTQTVDFSTVLAASGTDDQQLTLAAGNVLTLEDGGTVNLTPFLDNTDDQAITASLDNTTNVLTITLEDGGTQTVDFSTVLAAAGTDDQTVDQFQFDNTTNELSISVEDDGVAPLTVDLSVLDNAGTDDQQLTLAAGNVLTLEDGGTVNLTPFLDNTDDQAITASLDNTTNVLTITLEDGGTQTVDFSTVLAAAGTDDQQLTLTAGNVLTLEDGGTVNLTPFLDNTDDQVITASLDNTTNILTITLEDGGTQTVDFSTVLAAAGTDDQTVDQFQFDNTTNELSISVEDDGVAPLTVDLSALDNAGTDDQQLTLAAGNVLTLEDGGTVNLTPFLDNTDDQAITASLDNTTNVLTITLEDGGTQTVDFSTVLAAAGTDDQQLTLAAGNVLTLEDGGTVNLTPFLDNTDDQAITASLDNTTNILTITLEDGGTQTVDFSTVLAAAGTDDQQLTLAAGNVLTLEDGGTVNLTPFLDNTDDQAITASLDNTTNILTITLEDGGTQTVDFSTVLAAAGTDDQQLTLAAGNVLTLEDGGTVNLTPFLDNTDDQAITASLDNTTNVLTITLEDGGTQTVDFSTVLAAAGTDDQQLTLAAGNVLTLEDGGTVNLTPFLDNTDDQAITASLDNTTNVLTITLEDGGTQTVDFSTVLAAAGTDDQQLTLAAGNVLTLEDGGTVNLTPFLDNTDDQAITASLDNTTNVLTITLEDGGTQTVDFSTVLAAAGTDDQQLTLAAGNVLTLEDGGTVNLTPFLDNTDDQAITASLDNTTNVLTITLEDGGTQTVDFSTVLAAAGTDDQQLTLAAGNVLTLEDGGTVNLTPFLDNTDDQAITASLDNTTNVLTITLEDGGTQTVDFSTVLAAAGTDDQTVDQFQFDNTTNELSISVEDDGVAPLTVDLSALDNAGTDDQQLTLAAGNVLTLEDGGTVNLTPFLDNTDDQVITASLDNTTNILTITLEDGGTQTVDFSTVLAAAGTDDQQLTLAAGNVLTLEDGGTVNLTPFLDNTDDQAITASLDNTTNILTITLEDGGTQTVDFSTVLAAAGTDDQQLTLAAGNVLTLEDGGTVNLTPFLDNTDDQAITASLDNTTNVLTITLEDGGTQTVDFSTVLAAAGTDDQTVDQFQFDNTTNELSISVEDDGVAPLTVDLSALDNAGTDDQQLTLAAGNVLTLEDGGTVNLTPFLDNTDDQAITASLDNTTNVLTITLEDGGTQTVDFSTVLAAAGTDDQQLTLAAGNVLTLEDGGTVNLTPFLDNTDDQAITASLDNTTNILTITLEDGGTQTVDFSTVLAAAGTDDQQLTLATGNLLTLEDGGTVNLTPFLDNTDDQAITASLDNTTNVLTITLEDGGTQTVDFSTVLAAAGTDDQTVDQFQFDNTTNELSISVEDDGVAPLTVDLSALNNTDDVSTVTTTAPTGGLSGRTIATHDAGGTTSTIEESVTTLTQNDTSATGEITYTNEAGTATTAQVVSADANNSITSGSDGGAFFMSPVKAMGKVAGNGTALKILNATVSRINEGDYQITFNSPMPDANYIIQLATIDCGGDCPGNSGADYDDPGITYYNQTTTGFRINIGDSDNGTNPKDDIDLEFMFTVLDF